MAAPSETSNSVSTAQDKSYVKSGSQAPQEWAPIPHSFFPSTGLRGRKGTIFYAFVVFLFIVAVINLAVTILLLTVLRIGYGMESMEFIQPGLLLRFLNKADMGIVVPHSGVLAGFLEKDLVLTGDEQSVILKASNGDENMEDNYQSGPSIDVGTEWTMMSNVKEFRVRNPITGQNIFSTKYDDFKLPAGVPNLSVKEAHVSKIASPSSEPLEIFSPYQIILKGNEGLTMEGKEISFLAGLDVYLKSVNQSIVLDGENGVMISANKLPVASKAQENAPSWYKLCICMPSGRVFRVPVRDQGFGCKDIRFPESINPCS